MLCYGTQEWKKLQDEAMRYLWEELRQAAGLLTRTRGGEGHGDSRARTLFFALPPRSSLSRARTHTLSLSLFMGELTAQVGVSEFSNRKTWLENSEILT